MCVGFDERLLQYVAVRHYVFIEGISQKVTSSLGRCRGCLLWTSSIFEEIHLNMTRDAFTFSSSSSYSSSSSLLLLIGYVTPDVCAIIQLGFPYEK